MVDLKLILSINLPNSIIIARCRMMRSQFVSKPDRLEVISHVFQLITDLKKSIKILIIE